MKIKYKRFDIPNILSAPDGHETFVIYCNSKLELKIHNGDNIIILPKKNRAGYRLRGIKNIRYEKSHVSIYSYKLTCEYEQLEFTDEDLGVVKISFVKLLNLLDKIFHIYEKP